jgi:hypothetical protein
LSNSDDIEVLLDEHRGTDDRSAPEIRSDHRQSGGGDRSAAEQNGWIENHGWKLVTALTSLVIAFSAIRGVASGYQPAGDNSLLELRSRDVFTEHHPLLGTGSSASVSAGIDLNHPGPMLFDLMAIPIKLFGSSAGIAFAIAAVNIVVVCLVGVVVARAAGPAAALATQAITAGIAWSMGSELLYDPWQPNVLVLSFWLVLCTTWVIAAGHTAWLPLAVGFGSFAMQTHLSYLLLIPILLVFAVGSAARHNGWGALRRPLLRSGLVIAVLWAQPFVEQLFGTGQGNISRVVIAGVGGGGERTGGGPAVESTTTGLSLGLRLLGSVVALPPWWTRSGYDDSIPSSTFRSTPDGPEIVVEGLPSLPVALAGLLTLCAIVATAWWWARRSNDPSLTAGFQTLAVAAAVATVTAIITPVDILGLSPHKLRWLWVVAAFSTLMILLAAISALNDRRRPVGLTAVGALGLAAVLFTVPTYVSASGPMASRIAYDAVATLRNQVSDYIDEHPEETERVIFDADGIGFAEPYTSPIIAELGEHRVDFVVPDPSFPRQVGEGRRLDDDATRATIFVRVGAEALNQPAATRIAFHDGELTNWTPNEITDRAVGVFISFPNDAASDASSTAGE